MSQAFKVNYLFSFWAAYHSPLHYWALVFNSCFSRFAAVKLEAGERSESGITSRQQTSRKCHLTLKAVWGSCTDVFFWYQTWVCGQPMSFFCSFFLDYVVVVVFVFLIVTHFHERKFLKNYLPALGENASYFNFFLRFFCSSICLLVL